MCNAEHQSIKDGPWQEEDYCVNRGQGHPAFFNKCPIMVEEMNVQEVMATMQVSYSKAKSIVLQTVTQEVTYATVAGIGSCLLVSEVTKAQAVTEPKVWL